MNEATVARRALLDGLRDVMKAIRIFKMHSSRSDGVPSGTLNVLFSIDRAASDSGPDGGCHGKELASLCALDPSTISRAVAALVRAGLVERTADPSDGRASVLAPTAHGREVLAATVTSYDERMATALRDWSAADLRTLTDLLERFSTDLLKPELEAAR